MAIKVTNKKPLTGNRRSHACNATKMQQHPNLQVVTLEDGTKVRMSARELRTIRKQQSNASINNQEEKATEIAA